MNFRKGRERCLWAVIWRGKSEVVIFWAEKLEDCAFAFLVVNEVEVGCGGRNWVETCFLK